MQEFFQIKIMNELLNVVFFSAKKIIIKKINSISLDLLGADCNKKIVIETKNI